MGSAAQQYCLRWNNHRSNLLSVFDELLQNESFTDVTLSCDGISPIKCHKIVLAACSQYFQNLFTSLSCKHPVVVLKDVKYLEIKAILEYMYRGEVNVAQDQLAGLLKVAEALKVKGLVEENRGGENLHLPIQPRDDEVLPEHSPASVTTSNPTMQNTLSSSSCSPPHSTSGMLYNKSPYHMYKSSSLDRSPRMSLPAWAIPGLPISHHPSPTPPQNHPHPAATAAAAMLSCYDGVSSDMSPLKRKKLSSLLMHRDTPILRGVLGQGQVETAQPVSLVCHSDSHQNQHSNDSQLDQTDKHMKNEPLEDAQSPYTDLTIIEDEEKSKLAIASSTPQSYTGEMRRVSSGIATYVPSQKPEWKRYKQYTRDDILSAIDAVRNGMSALQAARKYSVPSRTLYDKVKKLGITTSRPFKRGSNGSNVCFPYGLSGTNSPYGGQLSENEEPTMNSHSALLEASSFLHALDNRGGDERDALAAMAAAAVAHAVVSTHSSPQNQGIPRSPSPNMLKYLCHSSMTPSPAPGSEHHHSETNGSSEREREDEEDQVEDLSINRKQESRVIMPPMNQVSTIMKKEEMLKEVLREECRREVSIEEGD